MRRILLCCLIIMLFAAVPLHAQPDSLWSRTFGGQKQDICHSIVQTTDGGFALGGDTYSFGVGRGVRYGATDFYLMRTDENGDSLWSRTYGGQACEWLSSLVRTADGGFALSGNTNSFGVGWEDFWLVRTDEDGDSLWSQTYGRGSADICRSLVQTADGGFALAGWTDSFSAGRWDSGGKDFWLVRTDENGDSVWSRTYGGVGNERCSSLIQTADGGFALAGHTESFNSAGEMDFWLVRTNENGDSLWSRTYGGVGREGCSSLTQTTDRGFALTGYTKSFGAGKKDFWLVRTNENGDSIWSRTYGGRNYDVCNSLIQTDDGGFILAGYTDSFGLGRKDFWLVRTDENGDSLWSHTYGGGDDEECSSLVQTADGGYALAGWTNSFGVGGDDFWLVKLCSENSTRR